MKEVFEFSNEEINKILFEELVRRGKAEDKRCSVSMTYNLNFGRVVNVHVSIGEPVPGAKEL